MKDTKVVCGENEGREKLGKDAPKARKEDGDVPLSEFGSSNKLQTLRDVNALGKVGCRIRKYT